MMAVSEEVPFVEIGARRGVTAEQMANNPHLAPFVKRFRASFEYAPILAVWLFIEPRQPRRGGDRRG